MLRAMAEIEFADGKFQVDDEYVRLIGEATNGAAKSLTHKQAMQLLGRVLESRTFRNARNDIVEGHFQRHGDRY